jgi:hypothetical protein
MATVTLRVKGEKGKILFDTFLYVMNNSFDILKDLDSAISVTPNGSLDWVVTKVSFDSPLTMQITSKPKNPEQNFGVKVVNEYVKGLKILGTEERTPPYFSESSLKKVRSIVSRLESEGAEPLEIQGNRKNNIVEFNKKMQKNTAMLIGNSYKSYGSVEGTLEMISIHGKPRFNIYDNLILRAVNCNMPDTFREKVRENLGRRVIASGIVSYNAKDEPISVIIEDFEIIPIEENLPSIDEFIGSDPDFTGNMTTGEYIRSLRNV